MVLVAYTTYHMVADPIKAQRQLRQRKAVPWYRWYSRVDTRFCIVWTVLGWLVGFSVAVYYELEGKIGPFEGIYCCTNDLSTEVVLPVLVVTTLTGLMCAFFYRKAYLVVTDVERDVNEMRVNSGQTSVASSPRRGSVAVEMQATPGTSPSRRASTTSTAGAGSKPAPAAGAPSAPRRASVKTSCTAINVGGGPAAGAASAEAAAVSPPASPTGGKRSLLSTGVATSSPRSQTRTSVSKSVDGRRRSSAVGQPGLPQDKPMTMSGAVARRGVLMTLIFYACWSFVSVNAAVKWMGVDLHPGWHVVAAWVIKLQPILDSLVVYHSVSTRKHRAKAQHNQVGGDTSTRVGSRAGSPRRSIVSATGDAASKGAAAALAAGTKEAH